MYETEADELINLVFDAPMNSATRQRLVADWLREFVAATNYGCTGLTTDPDGPSLELRRDEALDGLREGAEDETALRDTPDLSGLPYGPRLPSIQDWARLIDRGRRERYHHFHTTEATTEVRDPLRSTDGDDLELRDPDAYGYGEPWGPDNPAPGSSWGRNSPFGPVNRQDPVASGSEELGPE